MNLHDIITIKGKSLKGKNRVREHGNKWEVIQVKGNRAILLDPMDQSGEWRWMLLENDPDIEIVSD